MDRKSLKFLVSALCSVPFIQPAVAVSAAPNIMYDVPNTFLYMENSAEDVRAYHQAVKDLERTKLDLKQAESYLKQAEVDATQEKSFLAAAKNAAADAQNALTAAQQELEAARKLVEIKAQDAIDSRQAAEDFAPELYGAQQETQMLQSQLQQAGGRAVPAEDGSVSTGRMGIADSALAKKIARALEEVDYSAEYLEAVEAKIDALERGAYIRGEEDEGDIDSQDSYIDSLNEHYDAAEQQLDEMQDTYDALLDAQQQAEDEEADARQAVSDLEQDGKEAQQEADSAKRDAFDAEQSLYDAENNLKRAAADLRNAEKDHQSAQSALDYWGEGRSASAGMEFYSWQGENSGHQFYLPYDFSISDRHHNIDLSLSTGYISSDTGKENGHVSGWLDTTISVSRLNRHPKYEVRYNMSVNLPTGQSRISDNAVVPDDTAMFTRFGEGWNWTPGIEVTRHITDEDSLTWQTSYSIRGSYKYSSEMPDAKIFPGNLWNTEMLYLHAGEKEKLLGRIFFTDHLGETNENDLKYTEGNEFGTEVYYEHSVSDKDAVTMYGGLSYTGSNSYTVNLEAPNSGIHRRYLGIGMVHKIDKNRTFRLMGNYASYSGSSYDPLRNRYTGDRHRLSLLAGYEQKLNNRDTLSLYLERYQIHSSDNAGYNGWGARLLWNRNF